MVLFFRYSASMTSVCARTTVCNFRFCSVRLSRGGVRSGGLGELGVGWGRVGCGWGGVGWGGVGVRWGGVGWVGWGEHIKRPGPTTCFYLKSGVMCAMLGPRKSWALRVKT